MKLKTLGYGWYKVMALLIPLFVATNMAGGVPGAKSVSRKDATLTKAGTTTTKTKKRALMIS